MKKIYILLSGAGGRGDNEGEPTEGEALGLRRRGRKTTPTEPSQKNKIIG
jgi:hypothetical protein